jgi:hypothetical protein
MVPVTTIYRSCQLTPVYRQSCPLHWTSTNVLDEAPEFFINTYLDAHMFLLLRYS